MAATARGTEEQQTLEGRSIVRSAETAATAAAETAKAMVQSRFLVALNRPRNIDEARIKLLATCRRPRFAETARYKKPIGGTHVEGPSIRFADEAVKILGNIDTRQEVLYEDDDQRIVQVSVTDLETNLTKSDTICIKKTIERKSVRSGQEVIGNRENTKGEKVFIIRASDDELVTKEANLCAKKRRNLELQLIPQDIIEECMDETLETQRRQDSEDPDASRKRLLDAFASIGIMPEQIEEYLGHSTQNIIPTEFQALRGVFAAIRDSQTTWVEVMEAKSGGKSKADRASVNLDDIKAGDSATHKPVDAPLENSPSHEFKQAYTKLNILYDDHSKKIDDMLFAKGASRNLPDMQNATDPKEIAAIIKTAAEFKPKAKEGEE